MLVDYRKVFSFIMFSCDKLCLFSLLSGGGSTTVAAVHDGFVLQKVTFYLLWYFLICYAEETKASGNYQTK